MDPKIVERPEILLVGMPYFGDPSTGEFSATWMRFNQQVPEIPARVDPACFYGLEFYTEEMEKSHRWFYMASVEVPNLEVIPMGLVAKRLPSSLYAVHTVPAIIPKIGEGFGFLYQTWIPKSGYEIAHPYDFEFYEESRFSGIDVEGSEIDLYVPIKEKNERK